jgi:hypothetical protein
MKFIIIFILGFILIGGPLYVLYELGLKYKKKKKLSRKYKQNNIKKQDDAVIVSSYKIRFNDSKNNK